MLEQVRDMPKQVILASKQVWNLLKQVRNILSFGLRTVKHLQEMLNDLLSLSDLRCTFLHSNVRLVHFALHALLPGTFVAVALHPDLVERAFMQHLRDPDDLAGVRGEVQGDVHDIFEDDGVHGRLR
jgi:hypothetical protein